MRNTCFRLAVGIALLLGLQISASAQVIYGTVKNMLTGEVLIGAKVTLARQDSTAIDSSATTKDLGVYDRRNAFFFHNAPKEGGHWLLKVEKEGYQTEWFAINVPRFSVRRSLYFAGDLMIRRAKEHTLKDVTVHATKLKFYNHGDTLVYNADAFNLTEGSMLDALIRQLPGAELKDDGRILVNGKQIESLTLNGEDFFRGNNRVMLDNLPAYTVKQVKVYDKAGKLSQVTGRDMHDKEYTMDVTLKKEYQIGWLGNVEGGMGTKDRYLARLFGLRFTPNSRLTVYGNLNNLNDNRKPGENTEWTMDKMPQGLLTTRTGGIDYLINDRQIRFNLSGNMQLSHSDADNRAYTSTERFLSDGSSYKRTINQTKAHNIAITTSHNWELHFGEHNILTIQPQINYSRYRNLGLNTDAALLQDLGQMSMSAFLDSIQRPTLSSALSQIVSNRVLRNSLGRGHSLNSSITLNNFMKMPGLFDALQTQAGIHYNTSRSDYFDNRSIDYPAAAANADGDFRRRWDRNRPNRDWGYNLKANYSYVIGNSGFVAAEYKVEQECSRDFKDIFRLDSLQDWGYASSDHPLGAHPSDMALLHSVLDTWNTYRMRQNNLHQAPMISAQRTFINKERTNFWQVNAELSFPIQTHRLHYSRATFDGLKKRNAFFVYPHIDILRMWDSNTKGWKLVYDYKSSMPNLVDMIELDNTLDPVNITTGNAHLKNTHSHELSFQYSINNTPKQRNFYFTLSATLTDGAIGRSYMYDPSLGTYHFQTVNLSGVKLLSYDVYYQSPLTKRKNGGAEAKKPFFLDAVSFSTHTYLQLHSRPEKTGIVGEDTHPVNSTYNSYWATEDLRLKYDHSFLTAELSGYISWNRGHNSHNHTSTGNIFDFHYGADIQMRLPWKLTLATDLKIYSRRGYSLHSLNDDNIVWNMRVSKAFTPRLSLSVDAFDILGRLDNVSQVLSSGYHSETHFNSIPRYLMARLIYRFHIDPKKKK